MKHAIIDVGSNSIRLVVFDADDNGNISVVWNKKAVAGLASYIDNGHLVDSGVDRAIDVIGRFIDSISLMDVDSISVFGTAILRNIDNTKEACSRIENSIGTRIDVLSGEDEAYLGYVGCRSHIRSKKGAIMDIGGGSTEITTLCGDERRTASLPFGSLFLFLHFVDDLLPTKGEREAISEYVEKQIEDIGIFPDLPYGEAIGLGGSARAAIKLVHDVARIGNDRRPATRKQLQKLLDAAEFDRKNTLHAILRICPERVHTVLPGMIALTTIMDHMGAKTLEVSKRGIREGYLMERVLGEGSTSKGQALSGNPMEAIQTGPENRAIDGSPTESKRESQQHAREHA